MRSLGDPVVVFREGEVVGYCAKQVNACQLFRTTTSSAMLYLLESASYLAWKDGSWEPWGRSVESRERETCTIGGDRFQSVKPRALVDKGRPQKADDVIRVVLQQFADWRGVSSIAIPYFSDADVQVLVRVNSSKGPVVLTLSFRGPGWWAIHDFNWSGCALSEQAVAARIEQNTMVTISKGKVHWSAAPRLR
jgi:hypothetical protein